MKRFALFLLLLAGAAPLTCAETPSAEQLLPADTIAYFSLPDWDKAAARYQELPLAQVWRDAAMKPFKDKFLNKFAEDWLKPLEQQLGLQLAEYKDLLHGQVTLAFTPAPAAAGPDLQFGYILILDAKEKSEQLKSRLGLLRKKWVDAGHQLKSEKIRDVEFNTLVISRENLQKFLDRAFPDDEKDAAPPLDEAEKAKKVEVLVGQAGSLLLISDQAGTVEKVLARLAGGLAPPLAEQPAFQANLASAARGTLGYAWLHFKPIHDYLQKKVAAASVEGAGAPLPLKLDKAFAAVGLAGLQTISLHIHEGGDGFTIDSFLAIPEAARVGLFKIIAPLPKEATPPPFIPVDVVSFRRWRLDSQRAWGTLETMLTSISPAIAGLIQMNLELIGKDQDPNFDLRKQLIGNLGDDFISLQKAPRSNALTDLESPPSLLLIGSGNAEQLVGALRSTSSSLLANFGPVLKDREFSGRKIYSVAIPAIGGEGGPKTEARSFHFAAGGGYLAVSSDGAMIEEYLRGVETAPKGLRDLPGLVDAAQKVGGLKTGLFAYEHQGEAMRASFEAVRKDPKALEKMFMISPIGQPNPGQFQKGLKDWLDFSLLPPFDAISKYLHFTVYSGASTPEGLSFKFFSPVPPQLKK